MHLSRRLLYTLSGVQPSVRFSFSHFRLLLWNREMEFNNIWQETSSIKFAFFRPIGKIRWPTWPLIGWYIFDFSSKTAEQNSTKLDRKQDINVLRQVCVFRVDRKNKIAALASDSLRHFRLLLWNRRTEFNETWQEARSQRPLTSLRFSGRSEKQDGRLTFDWLRHFRLRLWHFFCSPPAHLCRHIYNWNIVACDVNTNTHTQTA